jgi:putative membrane protein
MFAGRMMGGYGYGGLCIFGGLLTLILVVALLAGLVLLGIWLWRRYGEGNGFRLTSGPSRLEPSPREILEARYARGELTREEFRSMVQDLSQGQNRREQEEVEIMKTRNVVLGIGLGVAGLLIAALGVGAWLWSRASYGYGYGCGMYGMMGGYGLPWGILMWIFWGLVLGGGVWLFAGFFRQEKRRDGSDEAPLEIARQRYAHGEIDREEFDRIRETLRS